jgi:hypothetical protein
VAKTISQQIAEELNVREQQVEATIALLDGGATVPFIARYRKEATGALDDAQLRTLEERLTYLRELEERRVTVLNSIREQGKLDATLEAAILAADSKGRLEDIYLPYKPKRRTKAEIAREAGLEPLADLLLTQPQNDPQTAALPFVDADKQVADAAAALDGARAILVERFAEDADLIGGLREHMWSNGILASRLRDGKKEAGAKFSDYFDFSEPLNKLPSHRILAMFRGEKKKSSTCRCCLNRLRQRRMLSVPMNFESCNALPSRIRNDRAIDGSPRLCAGHGEPRSRFISTSTCGYAYGPPPSRRRFACSPRTCAIFCSLRPLVLVRPWDSIRGTGPASRLPWWMRRARSWRPLRSSLTNLSAAGMKLSQSSAS